MNVSNIVVVLIVIISISWIVITFSWLYQKHTRNRTSQTCGANTIKCVCGCDTIIRTKCTECDQTIFECTQCHKRSVSCSCHETQVIQPTEPQSDASPFRSCIDQLPRLPVIPEIDRSASLPTNQKNRMSQIQEAAPTGTSCKPCPEPCTEPQSAQIPSLRKWNQEFESSKQQLDSTLKRLRMSCSEPSQVPSEVLAQNMDMATAILKCHSNEQNRQLRPQQFPPQNISDEKCACVSEQVLGESPPKPRREPEPYSYGDISSAPSLPCEACYLPSQFCVCQYSTKSNGRFVCTLCGQEASECLCGEQDDAHEQNEQNELVDHLWKTCRGVDVFSNTGVAPELKGVMVREILGNNNTRKCVRRRSYESNKADETEREIPAVSAKALWYSYLGRKSPEETCFTWKERAHCM